MIVPRITETRHFPSWPQCLSWFVPTGIECYHTPSGDFVYIFPYDRLISGFARKLPDAGGKWEVTVEYYGRTAATDGVPLP